MPNDEQEAPRLKRIYRMAYRPFSLIAVGHSTPAQLAERDSGGLHLLIEATDLALRRERARSRMQHWSYDVNRHLALKTARDRFMTEVERRQRFRNK